MKKILLFGIAAFASAFSFAQNVNIPDAKRQSTPMRIPKFRFGKQPIFLE